jgi:hypothetical protein
MSSDLPSRSSRRVHSGEGGRRGFTAAEDYLINEIFHNPEDYSTSTSCVKLCDGWRLPFRQILEYIFGL